MSWLIAQAPAGASTLPASTSAVPSSYYDNISMQSQQQNQWCWAASGTTIASYFNYSVNQNTFCNLAKGRDTSYSCPNWQGTLGDVQNAFYQLGFSYTGDYLNGTISFSSLQQQISANQPLETRIGWTSGGGHMHVLYGYDSAKGTVSYGDPWPSNQRYQTMSYNYYVSNSSFAWTHTLTGIRG
ncbi:papain-like cysteine protease family protein [Kutzneria viridogrisea]